MTYLGRVWPVLLLAGLAACAAAQPELRVSLDGPWRIRAAGATEALDAALAAADWAPAVLPLRRWPTDALNDAPGVWARRTVTLTPEQARRNGALHWGRVMWGVRAWVNGREVGSSPVSAPDDVLLPAGLLRAGDNEVVLRVTGWEALPKRDGVPLVPGGYPAFGGRHGNGVFGSCWIDLYQTARLAAVQLLPDLANEQVRAIVHLDSAQAMTGPAEILIRVLPWPVTPGAAPVGVARLRVDLSGQAASHEVRVPMAGAKLWSPTDPNLHLAEVTLGSGGQILARRDERFGQREFTIAGGRYYLNGERYYIRGENLMWQWEWGDDWYADRDLIRAYLLDFPRFMNHRGYRTHTSPPADLWLDVADEEGAFFISEFPMIQNYGTWNFTDADWAVYLPNALREAEGWVKHQRNRPSILVWAPTNEFSYQEEWQNTVLYDAMKALDPSRPILRAGQNTPDILDTHSYQGLWDGADGDYHAGFDWWSNQRDGERPLGCSEFCGGMGQDQQYRLGGALAEGALKRPVQMAYAQILMEQIGAAAAGAVRPDPAVRYLRPLGRARPHAAERPRPAQHVRAGRG